MSLMELLFSGCCRMVKPRETKPPYKLLCSVCGEQAQFVMIDEDGTVDGLCVSHLPEELYDRLCAEGWDGPPRATIH
jgi:hypothetical protein